MIPYGGQPAASYRCGGTEHVARLSAQDRTTGDYATKRQTNVGAIGRYGNTGNDNSETVHEEAGTADTISSCKDATPLPDQQTSAAAPMSATVVTVPAHIATQPPASALQ